MSDLAIILRSLRARLFSTCTTALLVAVAVALMLVLLSMRDAGRKAFERGAGNMHLLISRDASPLVSVLNGIFYANAPARSIEWARFQKLIESFPHDFAVPVQQGDSYRGYPVLATTPEFFTKFMPDPQRPWALASGAFFATDFEVVVGARAASESGLRVGATIFLTHGTGGSREAHVHKEFAYKVVGILAATGSPHDRALFTSLPSTWVLHAHDRRLAADAKAPMTTVADLIDADRLITGVFVRVKTRPGFEVGASLAPIFSQLRTQADLTVASPSDQIRQLLLIVSNVDQILLAMAGVVLVSSGIAIMLAMYNSMDQRRRQIAVLRVLGASQGRVFGLIVTESAIIGLMGAAAGVALCAIGSQIVALLMRQRLGLVIDAGVHPESAIIVAAATVLLASVAGVVPAVMAYRTPVSRSLRPIA